MRTSLPCFVRVPSLILRPPTRCTWAEWQSSPYGRRTPSPGYAPVRPPLCRYLVGTHLLLSWGYSTLSPGAHSTSNLSGCSIPSGVPFSLTVYTRLTGRATRRLRFQLAARRVRELSGDPVMRTSRPTRGTLEFRAGSPLRLEGALPRTQSVDADKRAGSYEFSLSRPEKVGPPGFEPGTYRL